jgi:hypothetical protein
MGVTFVLTTAAGCQQDTVDCFATGFHNNGSSG